MQHKRVFLFAGHYGSGKTNIAVNWAMQLRKSKPERRIAIADLDIVNPYFRTKDSEAELKEVGIDLICSAYANSNVDIPALPQETYRLVMQDDYDAVFDIGGDDRGAMALGRYAPSLLEEQRFEMWFVVNFYRPLTPDIESALEVMREIETAGGMPFTGIINNSNVGVETTADDVLATARKAEDLAKAAGIPVVMTTAEATVAAQLEGKIPHLFSMQLHKKIF